MQQQQPQTTYYNTSANAPAPGYTGCATTDECRYKTKQHTTAGTVCLFILCFFLPPLPVAIRTGCSADFCINIVLTILLWLPGVIHAMYVVVKTGRCGTKREREMGAAAAGGAGHPYGYKTGANYQGNAQYGATGPRTY